jgi:ribulose-phosphate 3-epimerase
VKDSAVQPTRIHPSILSADFANLGQAIDAVTPAADWVHVDVMDAHFVPNLTLGLPVVEALLRVSELPLDCHLMVEDPDLWAPRYAAAGAQSVTVHLEAVRDRMSMAARIQEPGARAGVALKPGSTVMMSNMSKPAR